ncbi:MAG TPA: MXAN_5187 C-terminal domain-containing protein [Vicinamibacterales bacterium]|nr:MXAN_5187 C-terminal domain-containing protein [Vicinamibacterales bacterium]
MPEPSAIERDLLRLEAELKRLESEYNMYFSGRLPRPPWETRSRVETLVKQYDRSHIQNYGDRFRFTTLQARFATFVDLWDRGLRAREEGRPGPFTPKRAGREPEPAAPSDRILHVAAFRDPVREIDKLTELYDSLIEARRATGGEAVPFHKFAELVKTQVQKLRQSGSPEVAFRVAVKDGKVSFTARALRGAKDENG